MTMTMAVAMTQAIPCRLCGTTGGYIPPGRLRPTRAFGCCDSCRKKHRRLVGKGLEPPMKPTEKPTRVGACVACGSMWGRDRETGELVRIHGLCRRCLKAAVADDVRLASGDDGRTENDPTPDEIAERAAEIRKGRELERTGHATYRPYYPRVYRVAMPTVIFFGGESCD